MQLPYSESCNQNREPILAVIQPLLRTCKNLLEIGSGTGQHAIYFAEKIPHINWQCSDCEDYLAGINLWIDKSTVDNVLRPFVLDVSKSDWPASSFDAVFTANSVHIMHQADVIQLLEGAGSLLEQGGKLIIYGPFNYKGSYTSESNRSFDQWLHNRDPLSGIKNFEDVQELAIKNGLHLVNDYEMPANNRILYFEKVEQY